MHEMNVVRDRLVGAWALQSFTILGKGSNSTFVMKPYGDSPLGRILVSSSGYLSANLTTTNANEGPDSPLIFSAKNTIAYAGPYELYAKEDAIWLSCNVEVAIPPEWTGGIQLRRVDLDVNKDGSQQLTLTPDQDIPLPGGGLGVAKLVWTKLKDEIGLDKKL